MLHACGWGSITWMMITLIHQWNCIHRANYIYVIDFIHEHSFIHARCNSSNKFYYVHLFSIWGPLMWSHFIHMHAWCTFVVNFIMNKISSIWHMSILRLSFCSYLFLNQICSITFFFSPCLFFSSVFSLLYASICPFACLPLTSLFPYHLVFPPYL